MLQSVVLCKITNFDCSYLGPKRHGEVKLNGIGNRLMSSICYYNIGSVGTVHVVQKRAPKQYSTLVLLTDFG